MFVVYENQHALVNFVYDIRKIVGVGVTLAMDFVSIFWRDSCSVESIVLFFCMNQSGGVVQIGLGFHIVGIFQRFKVHELEYFPIRLFAYLRFSKRSLARLRSK